MSRMSNYALARAMVTAMHLDDIFDRAVAHAVIDLLPPTGMLRHFFAVIHNDPILFGRIAATMAKDGDDIVGVAVRVRDPVAKMFRTEGKPFKLAVFVDPAVRRIGVGTALVEALDVTKADFQATSRHDDASSAFWCAVEARVSRAGASADDSGDIEVDLDGLGAGGLEGSPDTIPSFVGLSDTPEEP